MHITPMTMPVMPTMYTMLIIIHISMHIIMPTIMPTMHNILISMPIMHLTHIMHNMIR